jgi:uncharacterized protein YjbI with pentapeptide repeats
VRSREDVRWPAAPRIDDRLDAGAESLADDVSWSETAVGQGGSFSGAASGIEILGSRLDGVRLTGAVLEAGRWADVEVDGCELSATTLEDTNLVRVVFRSCRMSGLVAIGVKAKDVRFVDCKLEGANFRGSSLERCAFEDCDLRQADFYGARIEPGRLRRCALAGAEFSKANCDSLDLCGSKLEGVLGAASLTNCCITPDQMVPLGLALLAPLNVRVQDDPAAER